MAQPTKLQLQQDNARLARDNEALRGQVSTLQVDIERLNAQILNITDVASSLNAPRIADGVINRAAKMLEAKRIAMALGRCVKVE